MSLRRIVGVALAAAVASGAGLLLSNPSGALAPTQVTLEATGMTSPSCAVPPPLGVYGSIALKPATVAQFKQGSLLAGATSQSLTIKPAPNSTDPTSKTVIAKVPTTGSTPITFSRATTYTLTWQSKADGPLGAVAVGASRTGKLVITSNAAGCAVSVQVPVPSVSASAVPSAVTSKVNEVIGGVVSSANGALGPVTSALPTLPTTPTLPGVNPPVLSPPVINPPGVSPPGGKQGPGTSYKPTGPTVADRTMPEGYGGGSGLGGVFVPSGSDSAGTSAAGGSATGNSITAPGQQSGAGNAQPSGSAAERQAKAGASPRTVEVASNRPRSALGALPTLAVILAILALSGTTAFYARTFLLQPAKH